ncbi:MAG: CHAT domain-containing protein [Anaerolineales bacterium]|nr:CHAT domain-containing protein [Anaerolineales bacterium]
MLAWLGQAVMGPLVARLEALGLPQGALVRLIPGGWLGLLPLHAAVVDRGLQTVDRGLQTVDRGMQTVDERSVIHRPPSTHALDRYTFTYVPSAQALYHARPQAARPAESLLVVDNPDGTLVFSGQEAEAVQHAFRDLPVTTLAGKRATKARTQRAMSECRVLHFSTHGRAGWTESERSSIKLADGELTLPEVFALRLEYPRLAVLSACETSVPSLENPEEVEALPSGLMLAGVPGVVGSLWAVNDLSTALLMAWFYHFWREQGMDVPYALRQAQIYLRDGHQSEAVQAEMEALAGWRMSAEQAGDFLNLATLRDFAHPYYWAGFMFTGL